MTENRTMNAEPNPKKESIKTNERTDTCTVCSGVPIIGTPGQCGKG